MNYFTTDSQRQLSLRPRSRARSSGSTWEGWAVETPHYRLTSGRTQTRGFPCGWPRGHLADGRWRTFTSPHPTITTRFEFFLIYGTELK